MSAQEDRPADVAVDSHEEDASPTFDLGQSDTSPPDLEGAPEPAPPTGAETHPADVMASETSTEPGPEEAQPESVGTVSAPLDAGRADQAPSAPAPVDGATGETPAVPAEAAKRGRRIRIVRMRKSDRAEAPAAPPNEVAGPSEPGPTDVAHDPLAGTNDTGLTAEAEADLMAELAAVEREMNPGESAPSATVPEAASATDDAQVAEAEETATTAQANAQSEDQAHPTEEAQPVAPETVAVAGADPTSVAPIADAPADETPQRSEANAAVARLLAGLAGQGAPATSDTVSVAETPRPEPDAPDDDLIKAVTQLAEDDARMHKVEAAAERRKLALGEENGDEDRVNRILDKTNMALAGPEQRRRRSAIAHLKAAVAATRAEGQPAHTGEDAEASAYRADLAQIVKPQSGPTTGDMATERGADASVEISDPVHPAPADDAAALDSTADLPPASVTSDAPQSSARPGDAAADTPDPTTDTQAAPVAEDARPKVAPLMLVSAQRVDSAPPAEEPDNDGPVRPRRVTRGRLALEAEREEMDQAPSSMVQTDAEAAGIFAASTTFAEFAEKMGARGLSDLLECAAAYASYVEGRPHFSHPEIMRKVRASIEGQESLSREDSLRTFGQLLRQGKIRKVDRGQFTISQSSRYVQDARTAVQ